MKYYTLNQLNSVRIGGTKFPLNCNRIFEIFKGKSPDEPISGEELVNTLLDSDIAWKKNIIYKNHLFADRISPASVGEKAFVRVADFLGLRNCDFSTLYAVENAENCTHIAYGRHINDCHWSVNIRHCENVIFCRNLSYSKYAVLNRPVGKDVFARISEFVKNTDAISAEALSEALQDSASAYAAAAITEYIRRKYECVK